jgi:hypothetical protein
MFKLFIVFSVLLNLSLSARDGFPEEEKSGGFLSSMFGSNSSSKPTPSHNLTSINDTVRVSAIGMGVAPKFAHSPAQAYALAKRAAMVDAYRLLAERVGGVRIEGKDTIKNMEVTRSEVRAYVQNSIKNAAIVETKFKDGMCEVELEVVINYKDVVE